jgi:hypothetical protein
LSLRRNNSSSGWAQRVATCFRGCTNDKVRNWRDERLCFVATVAVLNHPAGTRRLVTCGPFYKSMANHSGKCVLLLKASARTSRPNPGAASGDGTIAASALTTTALIIPTMRHLHARRA